MFYFAIKPLVDIQYQPKIKIIYVAIRCKVREQFVIHVVFDILFVSCNNTSFLRQMIFSKNALGT